MNQLILRDISRINVKNIKLLEDKSYIKLRYEYKNICIIGISFKVTKCEIILHKNNYLLNIDKKDINQIKIIDDYLYHNIPYYKSFLKDNKISFYKNIFLDDFYNTHKTKQLDVILVIKYVKKGKDYYPIIHIQDGSQK
jgi:hypothetical protein